MMVSLGQRLRWGSVGPLPLDIPGLSGTGNGSRHPEQLDLVSCDSLFFLRVEEGALRCGAGAAGRCEDVKKVQ